MNTNPYKNPKNPKNQKKKNTNIHLTVLLRIKHMPAGEIDFLSINYQEDVR